MYSTNPLPEARWRSPPHDAQEHRSRVTRMAGEHPRRHWAKPPLSSRAEPSASVTLGTAINQ